MSVCMVLMMHPIDTMALGISVVEIASRKDT